MQKPRDNPTILALETAIGGGSICVYRDNNELAFVAGDDSVSRSEELLPNIKTLLAQVGIEPTEIDVVAVSRGPGSFTGIRIGLATALGLSRSLDIPYVGVPVMDAIAESYQDKFPLAVVLPMGKYEVVWKTFSEELSVNSEECGTVCSIDEIWSMVNTATTGLVHESLIARLPDPAHETIALENLGFDLAKFVGREAHRWSDKIDLSPIYIQNPAKRSNLF